MLLLESELSSSIFKFEVSPFQKNTSMLFFKIVKIANISSLVVTIFDPLFYLFLSNKKYVDKIRIMAIDCFIFSVLFSYVKVNKSFRENDLFTIKCTISLYFFDASARACRLSIDFGF
jgi:hypothetical protein